MSYVVFTALSAFFTGAYVEAVREYPHSSFAPYEMVIWGALTIVFVLRTHRRINRLASGNL